MSLLWSLEGIEERVHAYEFLKQLESRCLVYSPTAQQAYLQYDILPVDANYRRLVVLPKPSSIGYSLSRIVPNAISRTPFFILPDHGGYDATMKVGKVMANGKIRQGDFATVLLKLMHKNPNFLPVISSRNVKEIGQKMPILPISYLNLDKVFSLSEFSKRSLKNLVKSRLNNATALELNDMPIHTKLRRIC